MLKCFCIYRLKWYAVLIKWCKKLSMMNRTKNSLLPSTPSPCHLVILLSHYLATSSLPPPLIVGTGCHCYTHPPAQDNAQEKLCTRIKWSYTDVHELWTFNVFTLWHPCEGWTQHSYCTTLPQDRNCWGSEIARKVCHCLHHCYPQSGPILLPAYYVTC